MDDRQFDAWTKTLAAGQSRRALLRRLAGGLAGAFAVARWSPAAAAPPDHAGKPQGRCPGGYTNCRGTCVDLSDHPDHCGICNLQCSPGETCCGGVCTQTASFQDDPANCGACGNACAVDEVCSGGACQPCGFHGVPCCPPNNTCSEISFCDPSGICQQCGVLTGDPCCPPDNTCFGDFRFCDADGTCQPCGIPDKPCCLPDNTCGAGICTGGSCPHCGFLGGPCCPEGDPCFEGAFTCTDGTCS